MKKIYAILLIILIGLAFAPNIPQRLNYLEYAISLINGSTAVFGNCTAGKVVQNITPQGLQCIAPPPGTEVDPVWALASAEVARSGTCSPGTFVQNTSPSGVQCLAALTSYTETDPHWASNLTRLANLEASNTSTNGRIDSVNATAVGKASPGACTAGQVVQNVTASGVQCVADQGGGEATSWDFYIDGVLRATVANTNRPTTFVSTVGAWTESADASADTLRLNWVHYEANR